YVEILERPELRLTDRFTLALWFQSARTDQSQKYLLSKNSTGGQYAIIYEYTDDRVDFYAPNRLTGDDPRAGGLSEMPLTDTEWHHIAYAYDGTTFSGYIDGVEIFSREISFVLSDQFASSWFIGAAHSTANFVEGAIDEVRIYNYKLDPDEIAELAGTPVEEGTRFVRGDADASGSVNLTDGIVILNYLFQGGVDPVCLDAFDTDDSGSLNLTDGIYVLSYLFSGGDAPPPPFESCGVDPSGDADGVTCETTQPPCS
ncbi:MAG TPA: LamG domain-containing protein, partial [Planctomycetota bacterium]|nr:LamG domain-containing protein [Planctomycetota bacterium]